MEWPLSVGLSHQFSNKTQRREQVKLEMSKERGEMERWASFFLRTHSYLMFIIRSRVRAQKDAVAIFPTPLEPTPCDSPALHPGELSAWAPANKNSAARPSPRWKRAVRERGEVRGVRARHFRSVISSPRISRIISVSVWMQKRGREKRSQLEERDNTAIWDDISSLWNAEVTFYWRLSSRLLRRCLLTAGLSHQSPWWEDQLTR